jgi:valyl-tRNA synthetase
MDKAYTPGDIERPIYDRWESSGSFAPSGDGQPYCIMLPPPNVTGTLHMGHAFQHTLMDTLTRWHRMRLLGQSNPARITPASPRRWGGTAAPEGKHRLGEKFLERVWQEGATGGTTPPDAPARDRRLARDTFTTRAVARGHGILRRTTGDHLPRQRLAKWDLVR